jgi:hypothetical protein
MRTWSARWMGCPAEKDGEDTERNARTSTMIAPTSNSPTVRTVVRLNRKRATEHLP